MTPYEVIRHRHPDSEWLLFLELRCGTGYKAMDAERRIDAYAVHLWPSESNQRHAYEVKENRSDFLRELKQPHKRRGALRFSNYFWFVAPVGVIKPEDIPAGCGFLESNWMPGHGGYRVVVDAPYRDSVPPTWNFLASVGRHMRENQRAAK